MQQQHKIRNSFEGSKLARTNDGHNGSRCEDYAHNFVKMKPLQCPWTFLNKIIKRCQHRWTVSSIAEYFPAPLNRFQESRSLDHWTVYRIDDVLPASLNDSQSQHQWTTIPSTTKLFPGLINCCQHPWTISSITEPFPALLNRLQKDEMISNV